MRSPATARADEQDEQDQEPEGVILSPEEEERLVERLAKVDEDEKAGRLIPWEKVRAELGM